MLLLITLGLLILSIIGAKKAMFPDIEQLVLNRESVKKDASNPEYRKALFLVGVLMIVVLGGIQSIYLGFAVNFLLTKTLFAKYLAMLVAGWFFVGLLMFGSLVTKLGKAVDDPTIQVEEILHPLNNGTRTLFARISTVIWITFYVTVVFLILA